MQEVDRDEPTNAGIETERDPLDVPDLLHDVFDGSPCHSDQEDEELTPPSIVASSDSAVQPAGDTASADNAQPNTDPRMWSVPITTKLHLVWIPLRFKPSCST